MINKQEVYSNLILNTDSYKPSHWKQYPENTEKVYSYFESRGTNDDDLKETVFYGLQYVLKQYFEGKVVSKEDVEEAKQFLEAHFGRDDSFNYEGWMYIVNEHDGKLPLKIRAVPEGTAVPLNNVLMTVENTDPKCYWLTNYMETLLTQVWYPTTVASNSYRIREIVEDFYDQTVSSEDEVVDFQVHDFGFRGVSSVETAGLGSSAHLTSFLGTDTLAGIRLAQDFYDEDMAGFSIPASEHSTMTAWGGREGEPDAMENMLDQYPEGMIACVSDSYDIMRAVKYIWGEKLRDKILSRDGTLVIRPDSGDPVFTTAKIIQILWDKFGGTVNDKGYKVLDPHVRIIQGDGIDRDVIRDILTRFKELGFAANNIAFGSGGGLLQRFNRDTFKFAFKCCYMEVNGSDRDVRKFPMEFDADGNYTESFKISKSGRLSLTSQMETVEQGTVSDDLLEVVFEDGELVREQSFSDIRERVQSNNEQLVAA